jgi:putative tricarboxylic transport membrane protein
MSDAPHAAKPTPWQLLARADVLSGLLFIAIAAFGLWVSRDYPIGTALRMNTGYVPRLLCWILLGLGVVILIQGLRSGAPPIRPLSAAWRAVLSVSAALVAFGFAIERLGLVLAIVLLVGIGSLATKTLKPLETASAAAVLIVLSWSVFILGLGLTIPVWPVW